MDLTLLLEKAADLFNPETPKNIMQFKSFSGMLVIVTNICLI